MVRTTIATTRLASAITSSAAARICLRGGCIDPRISGGRSSGSGCGRGQNLWQADHDQQRDYGGKDQGADQRVGGTHRLHRQWDGQRPWRVTHCRFGWNRSGGHVGSLSVDQFVGLGVGGGLGSALGSELGPPLEIGVGDGGLTLSWRRCGAFGSPHGSTSRGLIRSRTSDG